MNFNLAVFFTPFQKLVRFGFLLSLLASGFAFGSSSGYAADEDTNLDNNAAQAQEKLWSIMLFGGMLNNGELGDVITFSSDATFTDTSFIGAALSREVWRNNGFSVELEAGLGQQFGDTSADDSTQVWGAAYLRYDKFPWDHVVHTSVATSIGLNYSTKKTAFENNETKLGDTEKLLHYFSPEIAFSLPEYRDTELVFRIHHRSSFFGFFGCTGCGSNISTVGIRHRF